MTCLVDVHNLPFLRSYVCIIGVVLCCLCVCVCACPFEALPQSASVHCYSAVDVMCFGEVADVLYHLHCSGSLRHYVVYLLQSSATDLHQSRDFWHLSRPLPGQLLVAKSEMILLHSVTIVILI
ncbi:hypothetical protein LSH36_315g05009 [Paralvinella palmiformis]|uniref:Uncharacterized protein n=1 Tax=Paralvinella palmiformis TaxID=53620 RepID=A0AAD9JGW3_9ANNE|nr:hypothetical protein LSH36_315g05009 [Paralvinella palmiformis]